MNSISFSSSCNVNTQHHLANAFTIFIEVISLYQQGKSYQRCPQPLRVCVNW